MDQVSWANCENKPKDAVQHKPSVDLHNEVLVPRISTQLLELVDTKGKQSHLSAGERDIILLELPEDVREPCLKQSSKKHLKHMICKVRAFKASSKAS